MERRRERRPPGCAVSFWLSYLVGAASALLSVAIFRWATRPLRQLPPGTRAQLDRARRANRPKLTFTKRRDSQLLDSIDEFHEENTR